MTYEEAKKMLDAMLSFGMDFSWQDDAVSVGLKVIEKQIKYRWHDLRKDPEDLPIQDGWYYVAVEYDTVETGYGYYENIKTVYGYTSEWNSVVPKVGNVIAWRYIEPFEEDLPK